MALLQVVTNLVANGLHARISSHGVSSNRRKQRSTSSAFHQRPAVTPNFLMLLLRQWLFFFLVVFIPAVGRIVGEFDQVLDALFGQADATSDLASYVRLALAVWGKRYPSITPCLKPSGICFVTFSLARRSGPPMAVAYGRAASSGDLRRPAKLVDGGRACLSSTSLAASVAPFADLDAARIAARPRLLRRAMAFAPCFVRTAAPAIPARPAPVRAESLAIEIRSRARSIVALAPRQGGGVVCAHLLSVIMRVPSG